MRDFVAIGDLITDAFIRLEDPRIHAEVRDGKYELSIPFADKVPFEEVFVVPAVGNASNAAASATILGLDAALVASVGEDRNGEECLESLTSRGIKTDFISVQKGKKTNYSYVLWFKDDRTILRKHEEFLYTMPDIGSPKWVYFSSIGEHAYPFHNEIIEYLDKRPEVQLAFQPGTNEIKLGPEKLKRVYERCNIFFSNVGEAERILGLNTLGTHELLKRVHALGPKIVVITDGPKGAYAFDGEDVWFQPPYPDLKPPYERTGAGDAFSSTTVAALALGKDLPTALSWGAINSMSVVQQVGAQKGLLSRSAIEQYLKDAPTDFKTSKFK